MCHSDSVTKERLLNAGSVSCRLPEWGTDGAFPKLLSLSLDATPGIDTLLTGPLPPVWGQGGLASLAEFIVSNNQLNGAVVLLLRSKAAISWAQDGTPAPVSTTLNPKASALLQHRHQVLPMARGSDSVSASA